MVLLEMVLPGLCSGFSGCVEEWQNHFMSESFFSSNVIGLAEAGLHADSQDHLVRPIFVFPAHPRL